MYVSVASLLTVLSTVQTLATAFPALYQATAAAPQDITNSTVATATGDNNGTAPQIAEEEKKGLSTTQKVLLGGGAAAAAAAAAGLWWTHEKRMDKEDEENARMYDKNESSGSAGSRGRDAADDVDEDDYSDFEDVSKEQESRRSPVQGGFPGRITTRNDQVFDGTFDDNL